VTITRSFELPPDKQGAHRRAVRLEWITFWYTVSAVFFIYLTLGSSQAMKAAWLEDMLGLLPPIAFLIADKVRDRKPNRRFPYGYHRAVSIAFAVSSLALFTMGALLLFDSVMKFISFEHPSIGMVQPFGEPVWLGWFMLPALVYSGIPAMILGRIKLPVARELHDKVLYADAKMNKANWLTAAAAAFGVVGIGLGLWWADALAAGVISIDIMHDGVTSLRTVVSDLMDRSPRTVTTGNDDPIRARIETELKRLDWVDDARARLREQGHVYFAEVSVVPSDQRGLLTRLKEATDMVRALDWKLHDVNLTPVEALDPLTEQDGEVHPEGASSQPADA
jgi:divalent metal cation (Fe/Co/Zn/Cd) transporter